MQRPTNLSILEHSVQEQCVISSLLTAVTVVSSCYCVPSSLPFNHFSPLTYSTKLWLFSGPGYTVAYGWEGHQDM